MGIMFSPILSLNFLGKIGESTLPMREGLQRKAHRSGSTRTLSGGARPRTCSGKPDPFARQKFKLRVE